MADSELVLSFPDSLVIDFTNSTGSTIAAWSLTRFGTMFGINNADILNGKVGAMHLGGQFKVTKAAGGGVTFALGQAVYWDTANKTAVATPNGNYLGLASAAAVNADTVVAVNINVPQPVFEYQVAGSAAGGGLVIDTGFGATPSIYVIQSRDTGGVLRTVSSWTWGSGGNLGKVTIVTSAGASSDTHYIRAIK
jgi:predicted RecA/RadA family phage recombinase